MNRGYAVQMGRQTAGAAVRYPVDRLVKMAQNGRKDEVLIEFARQTGPRFADMVRHFSALDGDKIQTHNNKALFLEGIDIWFRAHFAHPDDSRGSTKNPRDIIVAAMTPWYQSMELDDPGRFNGPLVPPPAYSGDPGEATALMLGACSCLEIQPLALAFGFNGSDSEPVRVWGRVQAGGRWYDSDINDPSLKLGDRPKVDRYEEVEVVL